MTANTTHRQMLIIVLVLIGTFAGRMKSFAQQQMPFAPGEKLMFDLKWGIIPAGTALLEVLPVETLDGIPVYHFVLTARTNSFVDIFYKVRDRIEGYANLDMTHSVLYTARQQEGDYEYDIVVTFDWQKHEAQYVNFGKEKAPIAIQPGTFDPLSILYAVRCMDIAGNSRLEGLVTDGKGYVSGEVKVLKQETLTLPAGTYTTYKLEPDTKGIGGVFKKSKNAKIYLWVTDDEYYMPVKLQSKVVIGSFTGELVSIEGIKGR